MMSLNAKMLNWVNGPQISAEAIALAESKGSYQHRIHSVLLQWSACSVKAQYLARAAKTEILET